MNVEIEITGEKVVIEDVPETTWEALKPFWPPLVRAILEVFLEGNFKPYSVRKNRKDGFYAADWYWDRSPIDPKNYPLKEAKRFIRMLRKNENFINAIKEFNKAYHFNMCISKINIINGFRNRQ